MVSGYRAVPGLWRASILVATFFFMYIVIAWLVRDFGMIWIFAWPVGWLIAGMTLIRPAESAWGQRAARLLLLGPLVAPVILAGGMYVWNSAAIPIPSTNLEGHMVAAAGADANEIRLRRFVNPNSLIDIGNEAAFGNLEQAAQLEPLTASYFGAGFLQPSNVVPPLLGYQFSDNLIAVHIAWPFGRFGLVVLLGSLLLVLSAFWMRPADRAKAGWVAEVGRLAALTFFWSGAYMALGNLNLAPFTGRNFYLLTATSTGDLLEGFVLLLLVVLPWVVSARRDRNALVGGVA